MATFGTWNPIDTAPRDGTPVLLFVIDGWPEGGDRMVVARFRTKPDGTAEWLELITLRDGNGFRVAYPASCWMPLPPAPEKIILEIKPKKLA